MYGFFITGGIYVAYQTLYRKWRPKTFDEVIGQPHITNTLKNEIVTGKISHAYIFTGTRGTGKTSTAKILSRALNCLSPKDGNPCNECDVCRGILNETILDVVEMDAASNNGVENIRDIIDQVRYATASSKYKVYIIDEVHMLSSGAFNALLKTLEEPPEHVIFILATTEIHKVLPTILSRCQRFDFKNITASDIADAIEHIMECENINMERSAAEYIAQLGNGSMRDALSITEQCLAYKPNDIGYKDVTDILGTLDDTFLYDIASDIANGDVRSVLMAFNECMNGGKNPESFAEGLLGCIREILVYKLAPETADFTEFKRNITDKTASAFTQEKAVRCIEILSELIRDMKFVSSPRILAECTLVRLASPSFDTSYENLLNRIAELEKRIETGAAAKRSTDSTRPSEIPKPKEIISEPPSKTVQVAPNTAPEKPSSPVELADVIASWNDIKARLQDSGRLRAFVNLFGVNPKEEDGQLVLPFKEKAAMNTVAEADNIGALEQIIYEMFSKKVKVRCVFENKQTEQTQTDNDIFRSVENLSGKFPENFKID